MQYKSLVCMVLCLIANAVFGTSTLLIFQDMYEQQIDDDAGMNVAHQVLTNLIQRAAPMLVAQDVWNHIMHRQHRYQSHLKNKSSVYHQIPLLVHDVNQRIRQGVTVAELNTALDAAWYHKKYPRLASLSAQQNNLVMFDYFCGHVDQFIDGWHVYNILDQYLLFLPYIPSLQFKLHDFVKLLKSDILSMRACVAPRLPLDVILQYIVSSKFSWTWYITGHGHYQNQNNKHNLIAGMPVDEFANVLRCFQNIIPTKVLVYSSCYSAGKRFLEPYCQAVADGKLNYWVVATCLSDAPVYVFGTASGLKLPPYNQELYLETDDVDAQGLRWSMMQNFSKFTACAQQHKLRDMAQAVMMYQECSADVCTLAKLENIALVRKPSSLYFVPLDTTYVTSIMKHTSKDVHVVSSKHGLLWYVKQYFGTVRIEKTVPQSVAMVPGSGVVWMQALEVPEFELPTLIKNMFFSIEDMHAIQIFLCDLLQCKDHVSKQTALHNVMVLMHGGWLPKGFDVGALGIVCYQQNSVWYALTIDSNGQVARTYQLSDQQKEIIKKLWTLLRIESRQQHNVNADQLWSASMFAQRTALYEKLLMQCQQQAVCV